MERNEVLFAEKIELLINNIQLRKQLGKQAVDYIRENWTWEQAVDNLEQMFTQVVDNNQNIAK